MDEPEVVEEGQLGGHHPEPNVQVPSEGSHARWPIGLGEIEESHEETSLKSSERHGAIKPDH